MTVRLTVMLELHAPILAQLFTSPGFVGGVPVAEGMSVLEQAPFSAQTPMPP